MKIFQVFLTGRELTTVMNNSAKEDSFSCIQLQLFLNLHYESKNGKNSMIKVTRLKVPKLARCPALLCNICCSASVNNLPRIYLYRSFEFYFYWKPNRIRDFLVRDELLWILSNTFYFLITK